MRNVRARFFAVVLPAMLIAADTRPVSPKIQAVEAVDRRATAVAKASKAYQVALIAADSQLIADLDNATTAATKDGDLPTANAIADLKQDAVIRLDDEKAGKRIFLIRANRPWQPTMHVHAGEKLHITATGTWCACRADRAHTTVGPGGKLNAGENRQWWYLEMQLGTEPPVEVDDDLRLTASRDGTLAFQMDDPDLTDNEGALRVCIEPVTN